LELVNKQKQLPHVVRVTGTGTQKHDSKTGMQEEDLYLVIQAGSEPGGPSNRLMRGGLGEGNEGQSGEEDRIWNDRRVHQECRQVEYNYEGGEIVTHVRQQQLKTNSDATTLTTLQVPEDNKLYEVARELLTSLLARE